MNNIFSNEATKFNFELVLENIHLYLGPDDCEQNEGNPGPDDPYGFDEHDNNTPEYTGEEDDDNDDDNNSSDEDE